VIYAKHYTACDPKAVDDVVQFGERALQKLAWGLRVEVVECKGSHDHYEKGRLSAMLANNAEPTEPFLG